MTARLKVVAEPGAGPKPPRDIYAADKALAASIDWAAVHIAGDRRAPVDLPDTRKRGWEK